MLNTILASLSEGIAPSTTAYESIATVTVGSGGSSSIDFTSIPSTYTHLQVRGITRTTTGGLDINQIRFNSDTGSNYATHRIEANGSSVSATATASTVCINGGLQSGSSTLSNTFGAMVFDILDYANTNKYKTLRHLDGIDANGTGLMGFGSGLWMNTNAITSITIFTFGTDFAQYSQFALYGIKGS